MAKTSLKVKQGRKAKFKSREYNRCRRCGRPRAYYRKFGLCAPAIPFYRWTWDLDPDFPMGRTQLANCLLEVGQYDSAKVAALGALKAGGPSRITHRLIKLADSSKAAAHSAAKKNDTAGVAAVARPEALGGKLPETLQKTARKADVP